MKKLIVGSLLAAGMAAFALPASAHVGVGFYVNAAPPAPVYEVVPAPRVGWVWVPGYWSWRYGAYAWVPGHWVRERVGYVYEPPRWVGYGPRWGFVVGGWHAGRWHRW